MLKNNLKGLWIPVQIITDINLSDKEKLIYSLLLFFSTQNGYCTTTNSSISELFSISKIQVSKLITSLKEKGYINTQIIRNSSKQITSRTITPIKFFTNTTLTKVKYPIKENIIYPISEKFKYNKIYLKNKYIKDQYSSNRMKTSPEYKNLDFDSFYSN